MEDIIYYGGDSYIFKGRMLLSGMEYVSILENTKTGESIYLYCFSG